MEVRSHPVSQSVKLNLPCEHRLVLQIEVKSARGSIYPCGGKVDWLDDSTTDLFVATSEVTVELILLITRKSRTSVTFPKKLKKRMSVLIIRNGALNATIGGKLADSLCRKDNNWSTESELVTPP